MAAGWRAATCRTDPNRISNQILICPYMTEQPLKAQEAVDESEWRRIVALNENLRSNAMRSGTIAQRYCPIFAQACNDSALLLHLQGDMFLCDDQPHDLAVLM